MSSKAGVLVDPKTGVKEQTWSGFSWPCLLFGVFWFLYKRLYNWAAITFLAALITGGIAWLFFPFFANGVHRSSLQKSGWLTESQVSRFRDEPLSKSPLSQEAPTKKCPVCAEIIKLEAIKCRFCGEKFDPDDVARQLAEAGNENNIENRVLCSDGNCIGVIGANGLCKVCGKKAGSPT